MKDEIRELMGNVTDVELSLPEGTLDVVAAILAKKFSVGEIRAMDCNEFSTLQADILEEIKKERGEK